MCINICIISVKMHLLTLWPWPFNLKTTSFLEYPKVIPSTKFKHYGIICFWVMLRTNRLTDSNILHTPTDSVKVGDEISTRFNSIKFIMVLCLHILLMFFYEIADVHNYNTRHAHDYHITVHRTSLLKHNLRIAGLSLWNSLDSNIKLSFSVCSFRIRMKKALLLGLTWCIYII